MNVVFIGAGNLATHLALALFEGSFNILQIYSRTIKSANTLASKVNAKYTNKIDQIIDSADIYIFSVKDFILLDLIKKIKPNYGIWLHTAGSIDLDVFKNYSNKYGVFYPFQTFSKDRPINFKNIPIYIEANTAEVLNILKEVGDTLSNNVSYLASNKRQYLHLTGVFACNFVNHMYHISEKILKDQEIPFGSILPLIDETTSKIHSLTPHEAQTGPAIRYDKNVITKHLSLINDPDKKKIYELISQDIHKEHK